MKEYDIDNLQNEYNKLHPEEVRLTNCITTKNNEISYLDREISRLEREISSYKKKQCPTCGQDLQDDSLLNKCKDSLVEKQKEKEACLLELNQFKSDKSKQEVFYNSIVVKLNEASSLKKRIDSGNLYINNTQSSIISLEKTIQDLKSKDTTKQTEYIRNEIKLAEDEKIKLLATNDILQRDLAIMTMYVNKFFKSTGILMTKLNENIINMLQTEFDMITTYPVKVKDDLSLEIKFGSHYLNYGALSKGQSRVVDILTIIALNNIFSKIYGLNNGLLGIICLDELFSYFDSNMTDYCLSLLDSLACDKVLVISHESRLIQNFNSIIEVSLDDDKNSVYKFI